jgi:protein phosphatase PTC1
VRLRAPPLTPPPFFHPSRAAQSAFIIIACDGVWDVLEDQEAVDMVRAFLSSKGGDLAAGAAAAQILVDASLAKGSSDNVTACVVLL